MVVKDLGKSWLQIKKSDWLETWRERKMQREFEKVGRERRKLHAQWRERERCCKSKSEHPTDFLSSLVQIKAHRASLPVKRGCERERIEFFSMQELWKLGVGLVFWKNRSLVFIRPSTSKQLYRGKSSKKMWISHQEKEKKSGDRGRMVERETESWIIFAVGF